MKEIYKVIQNIILMANFHLQIQKITAIKDLYKIKITHQIQ